MIVLVCACVLYFVHAPDIILVAFIHVGLFMSRLRIVLLFMCLYSCIVFVLGF